PTADLAITKTDGATSVKAGTSTTYTIVVSNNGPNNVTGASVSDAVPAGVTSDSWTLVGSSGGGAISSGSASSGTGALSTKVDLPSGASVTFSFSAHISATATGNLVNTATVTPPSGVTDTNLNNNSATDTD